MGQEQGADIIRVFGLRLSGITDFAAAKRDFRERYQSASSIGGEKVRKKSAIPQGNPKKDAIESSTSCY
jgi:hypothetical protein